MNRVILYTAIFATFTTSTVEAALLTSTDRTTWESESGGSDYTIDFNSFQSDTSYNDTPVDLGPFSLRSNGADASPSFVLNVIDVSPFRSSGFDLDGTPFAFSRTNQGSTNIEIAFDQPVTAFAADFAATGLIAASLQMTLHAVGGATEVIDIPDNFTGKHFFGFYNTSGTTYTHITFDNQADLAVDAWGMDNISAKTAISPVPEPSSMVAWSLLGLSCLGYRWRQKRAIA